MNAKAIVLLSLLCLPAGCGPAPSHAADAASAAISETRLRQGGAIVTSLTYDSRVFFDSDQDRPRPEASPVLDALALRILADRMAVHIAVLGHTDAIGSDAYNLDLGRRRALSVVHALAARGIAPERLAAIAIGKRQPIASDADEAGRARNRRVEFLISPSAQAIAAVIRARPRALALRQRHAEPWATPLRERAPDPLSRAPLGAAVPF